MPSIDVSGTSVHYDYLPALSTRTSTPGQPRAPLLMLAGMASDSASWQPVIAPLRQHQALLIPDNRGSGRTRATPLVCSREHMLADILGLLDALEIERVNVLGHSMGGMLGWALASAAPERVGQLISAAALPSVLPARIALFRSLLALRTAENERDWFSLLYQFLFSPHFFEDEAAVNAALDASTSYPWKQGLAAFAAQVQGLESFRSSPIVKPLRCPVTLLTGSEDTLMTPHMLMTFSREHHVHTCHVIDGAAHALHWEQPAAFVELVERSLASG